MNAAPDQPDHDGTTSNRYTILGRLAGGGMADIFVAKSTSIAGVERHVVLKRVLAEHSRNTQFAKMFLDEARLAMQLQHPNIAQVYDVGMLAGSYFFTMEYVHGSDVRAILARLAADKRTLPISLVLHVISGALAALHHAHERSSPTGMPLNVVHRDVTPSNVMVSYEGTVKLLDFGVAKATQNTEETRSGMIKGKIGYLSPEQCRTSHVDRRSDIFSLGIVMHEMLTCRRLYRYDSDFLTMNAITNEPPAPPSRFREDVSPELDAVVLEALAKEPDDRFATAADMLEAIERVAASEHHQLSGVAMGRFLRELFGERAEPWRELGGEVTTMTVTGGPVASLVTPNPLERALAAQLDRVQALPAAPERETVSELPPLQGIPSLPPPPLPRNKWPLVIAGGLAAVVAILLIVLLTRAGAPAETPAPSGAAAAAPTPSEAAAPSDAAVASSPAPVVEDAAAGRTIAAALVAGDWLGALQLCVVADSPTGDDRRACGIAACNAKRRDVALDYYELAPEAVRPAIERACRVAGITLRGPARPPARPTTTTTPPPPPPARPPPPAPPPPAQDPCEIDPLQCQK